MDALPFADEELCDATRDFACDAYFVYLYLPSDDVLLLTEEDKRTIAMMTKQTPRRMLFLEEVLATSVELGCVLIIGRGYFSVCFRREGHEFGHQ